MDILESKENQVNQEFIRVSVEFVSDYRTASFEECEEKRHKFLTITCNEWTRNYINLLFDMIEKNKPADLHAKFWDDADNMIQLCSGKKVGLCNELGAVK